MDAKLVDEPGRLCALERLQVLDTAPEPAFDRLTSLVRTVLQVPISAVSLVDSKRQWFKSIQGLDASETHRDVAFCAHTIMSREPLVVADATLDARFATNPLVTGEPGIRSYAGVPLSSPDGYNLGSLCAIDTKPRTFSDAQIALLADFAGLVVEELELRTLAQRDFLTGTLTRRAFVEGAKREIDRSTRYLRPTSLIVLDVDHFKQINDKLGHSAGDEVLKLVAAACTATLRPNDLLGRMGGEEFAICLPETDVAEAQICAERLRKAICSTGLPQGELRRVTASFGIATLLKHEIYEEWFARADAAMYAAKRSGRNRCRVAALHSVQGVAA